MQYLVYIVLFVQTLLLSLLLVPLARKTAFRFNILDKPGERKIHAQAKPYLGGVAVFLSFIIVIGFNLVLAGFFSNTEWMKPFENQLRRLPLVSAKLIALFGASLLIVVLGIIDDIQGIGFSPKLKLLGQFVAAGIVVAFGIRISFLGISWLNIVVSMIWIIGITNSFNLLDNMDGLSAGVAAIAGLIFFAVTALQGQVFVAMILIALVGSILGFLKYNYNPSSIFMGDAGSMFLGFMLGSLTITASYVTPRSSSLLPAIMPLAILSIPLFDTISVVIIRIKEHRPVYVGDKRHLSHRLVDMGFSQRSAVNLIYLLTFTIGMICFLLPYINLWQSLIVIAQVIFILVIISILMFVGRRSVNQQR